MDNITENENKAVLPVLPLRGLTLFPNMMLHFDIGRKKSALAIDQAMKTNQTIFITTQKDIDVGDPKAAELYSVGVIARIIQVLKQPENIIRIVVEGISRACIASVVRESPFIFAEIEKMPVLEDEDKPTLDEVALVRTAKSIFEEYVHLSPKMANDILYKVARTAQPGRLADFIAGNIFLDYHNKQVILETLDPALRLEKLIAFLNDEVYILGIENEINRKAKESIDESQKEYFLREQIRAIEDELGEDDDGEHEAEDYRNKILKLNLKKDIEEVLLKECTKLEKMPYGAHETTVIRTYLDTCLELPWNIKTTEKIDIPKVQKALDKNHYGLTKVKERIIELLAVRKLSPEIKGQIICLVGPPGVGKTSIAQSIAAAINRKSARIALGGVRDESEIRGHRRTYIGAMPGRIINAIKTAKSSNPLIILDEIDKLGNDFRGDPTSALLEVLDSEQNSEFYDHYIDLPYDLSDVMFITTANDYSAIPEPLLDRMDVIQLDSYTREEKFNIAKKHLLPKQMKNCGITSAMFKINDAALYAVIDNYTREAGVRTLERTLTSILRKAAVKIIDKPDEKIKVTVKNLEEILGPKKYKREDVDKTDEIGVVNGMAWTSVGGELLPIEAAVMDGSGKIELTGSLGDVMKESAHIAVSWVRSNCKSLGIKEDFYKTKDLHIHAPEGAVPKDGPSAGVTMTTAIVSALSDTFVNHSVAMTGEITLRGKVLPIGGLKEKTMAAYRAGIKKIIIPEENKADLAEVDSVVKKSVEFVCADNIVTVLDNALVKKTERAGKLSTASGEAKKSTAHKEKIKIVSDIVPEQIGG